MYIYNIWRQQIKSKLVAPLVACTKEEHWAVIRFLGSEGKKNLHIFIAEWRGSMGDVHVLLHQYLNGTDSIKVRCEIWPLQSLTANRPEANGEVERMILGKPTNNNRWGGWRLQGESWLGAPHHPRSGCSIEKSPSGRRPKQLTPDIQEKLWGCSWVSFPRF